MDIVELTTFILHSLFAGLWTGSVVFVTAAVIPAARNGNLNATPLHAIAGKLTTISRASALVLFITGSHMAAARYTRESLFATQRGYLVLSMVLLWLLLAGIVEVATSRVTGGTGRDKVREPAHESWRLFLVASVLSVLLLVNAGLLSTGRAVFV